MFDAGAAEVGSETDLDLFGQPLRPGGRNARGRKASVDADAAARIVEAHPDFRIQRRLQAHPAVGRRPLADGERMLVVLDTETTGLNAARDEMIELGMMAVLVDASGRVVEVLDAFNALREPAVPLPPEVTRLTGITPEMLVGQTIDAGEVERFASEASLVGRHNASFDRPFCERLHPVFSDLEWACSVREVDWAALGFEGSKLAHLLSRLGWFHEAHRAIDDCHALLGLLASQSAPGRTILSGLLAAAARPRFRTWAEQAPFEAKERLKGRRYRWSDGSVGRPRCWWVEVTEEGLEEELRFLRDDIYGWDASPRVQRLMALERYRSD